MVFTSVAIVEKSSASSQCLSRGLIMLNGIAFRAVLCLIFAALPLAAQNASLAGTVKDQQGGFVPNAAVTLTSADTGVSQAIAADGSGNFEFPTVRPATYTIKVAQKGFQTYTQTGIV